MAAGLLAIIGGAPPALAHGFGQRYDLPVPLELWLLGAAAAVALSFLVVGLAVRDRRPRRRADAIDLLPYGPVRALAAAPVVWTAQLVSVGLLVLVVSAGIVGDQNPTRNLAPVVVWVVWWAGLAYVSALAANVWAVVNPWATIFAAVEWFACRAGRPLTPRLPYPAGAGRWPAVLLFGAFAWIELVYTGRSVPAQIGVMAVGYSVVTWTGMATFGRTVWLRRGDPFAAAFDVLAQFAPLELRVTDPRLCEGCHGACAEEDGCVDCGRCFTRASNPARQLNLRPYGAGLLRRRVVSVSTAAFVLLLLSTVTFDGLTATPAWARLEDALYAALAPLGALRLTAIMTLGLLGFSALFALLYAAFAWWMAGRAGRQLSTVTVLTTFVLSLVPIAVAYHLAHYLGYLLIQGQLAIRIASDPFGVGWNLLGTARYRPDLGIIGARFTWYTSVLAIVAGHVVAVYVAHVVALRAFPSRRSAVRSQFPMLVLMVAYTVVSLWIIAQPIVESRPAA